MTFLRRHTLQIDVDVYDIFGLHLTWQIFLAVEPAFPSYYAGTIFTN